MISSSISISGISPTVGGRQVLRARPQSDGRVVCKQRAAPLAAPPAFLGRGSKANARGRVVAQAAEYSAEQLAFLERRKQDLAALGSAGGGGEGVNGGSPASAPPAAAAVSMAPGHWASVAPLSFFAVDQLTPKGPRTRVHRGAPEDFSRALAKGVNGNTSCGSWACTEGGWDSPAKRGTTEWFFVLKGSGQVTDLDGTPHPFKAGDVVVLPKGWSGTWDVYERIHKVWVIVDHDDIPGAKTTPEVHAVGSVARPGPSTSPVSNPTHGKPADAQTNMYYIGPTSAGYWTCTPGGFSVPAKSATECLYVLEGIFFLTNADGSARRCVAGDTVVLPKGWSGQYDVIETIKTLTVEVK